MKKLLLILLCVPLIFSCGESNTEGIDAIPEKDERNSILWKIEKDNKISYLFGTTHIMCKDEMKYKKLLKELVEEVSIIVTESDYAETPEGSVWQYGKGFGGIDIPDEYKIGYIYSEYELRVLFNFLSDLGYDENTIDFLFNTDLISFSMFTLGACLPDCEYTGSEIYIESILDDKEELYLEDNKDMSSVFSKWINYFYQNTDLETMTDYSVKDIIDDYYKDCSEESLEDDMDNYNNNDPQEDWDDLMDMRDDEVSKVIIDGMVKYLIKERNRIWIPRMIDIMDDDKILFAVGSLHVLDLVERLEKKGYKLTPLDI